MSIDRIGNPKIAIESFSISFIYQAAADVVQEFADFCFTNVKYAGLKRASVIKRYTSSQLHQLCLELGLLVRVRGLRTQANIELTVRTFVR